MLQARAVFFSFFLFSFLLWTSVACRPITSLLSLFLNLFFITFFFFFFVVVHRSSSSVLSFFVCVFGQTLTNAQFHTNVYKYVKYIAQGCCESVVDIFFNFIYFLRGCIWTQFILIIMHFSNLILFRIKRIDHNIYHIWCVYLLIHIFAIRITWLMARTSLPFSVSLYPNSFYFQIFPFYVVVCLLDICYGEFSNEALTIESLSCIFWLDSSCSL